MISVLLSLKRSPVVRYRDGSDAAKRVAKSIHDTLTKESSLCSFGSVDSGQTVLLVLDRRDDPVTPLLNQVNFNFFFFRHFNFFKS